MTRPPDVAVRRAESDADLEAWIHVRRIVLPDEPRRTVEALRSEEHPDRLLLLALAGDEVVGHGLAGDSSQADGFVAPRVMPAHRTRGVGGALLRVLLDHQVSLGHRSVVAHVVDDASVAFATNRAFVEVDRQIEQVRRVGPHEPVPLAYPGVEFVSVAADPGLLPRAYPLARQGHADFALAVGALDVPLDEWLRDEATLAAGSIVALAGGSIVGYAGLLSWNDDDSRAENGLTVVDRGWRGRGLATALKRRQLAWASANGIREIVTWTQDGNDAMRRVNTGLGYATRSVSRTVRRDLP